MVGLVYPPSPALSACDSLAGIDDLDAFLARQGSLSHFPTPPLKEKAVFVEAEEIYDTASEYSQDDAVDYARIAAALADEASIDVEPNQNDNNLIRKMLERADLPLEVVALAFNIAAGLHELRLPSGTFSDCPPDLLVVAALSLAVSYTDDHPPQTAYWSRHVCNRAWTTSRIEKTVFKILGLLDWQLLSFTTSDAIYQTITIFCGTVAECNTAPSDTESTVNEQIVSVEDKLPLKLTTSGTSTHWEHGLTTPDTTPPSSALEEATTFMFGIQYLPLL